jgi:hypothetical protein
MPARRRDRLDQVGTQFLRDVTEFGLGKPAQVRWRFDAGEAGVALLVDHGNVDIQA